MRTKHLVSAVVSIALLGGLPATASAGPISGSLTQLPRPADCVSTDPASACGTIIEGGTTEATSVRVSPDGENVYTAAASGAVATFNRNESSGALSFARCVKDRGSTEVCQTNVSSNPSFERILENARWIVVSPDGKNVYVAASAGSTPGFLVDAVTAFARNQTTGALTPLGGKNLCISETRGGAEDNPDRCRQGFGLSGVERMEISPDGLRLYAVSPSEGTLAVIARDPDTGALTQERRQCFRGTDSPDANCGRDTNPTTPDNAAVLGLNNATAVAVSPDNDNVYTVSNERSTLVTFRRTPIAEGGLAMVECKRGTTSQEACPATPTQGLNAPNAVEVSPDGNDVYTASSSGTAVGTGNTLTEFSRADADGSVDMERCVRDDESIAEAAPPGGPGGCTKVARGLVDSNSIAIKPDGRSLYVSAEGSNDIAEFTRAASGEVTPLPGEDQCIQDDVPEEDEGDTECPDNEAQGLAGIRDLNLSPDGLFLYSAATDDSAVAAFSVQVPPTCSDVTQPASPNNQPVVIPLRCTDANRDPFTLEIVSPPDPANGTVTINQANDTATFTPATGFAGTETFTYRARDSRGQASNVATVRVTIAAPGAPVITISDAATTEGNSGSKQLTFTLRLSSPLSTPTTVNYSTADDGAQAPSDYTAESGTATFAANRTETTVTVTVNGDTVREADERFEVNLRNPSNGAVIGNSQAFGTISNDDQSVISINDVTVAESAGVARFTVSLSNASDSTVEATYGTQNDTATAPADYTARSNLKVSFAPGERTKEVTVPIVNDTATEQTERFNVNLTSPTAGVTLGKARGVGTITDNDAPSLRISDASVAEGQSETRAATFTISLSAPVSNPVGVSFATVDGSAVQPGDYTGRTGTVSFAPGETSKTITVDVKGDTEVESDEAFIVRLSNPAGATIADADGAGTIVNDDERGAPPAAGVLSVSDVTVPEGNTGTREAPFTVSLSAPQSSPVTVRFGTADDTATAADYRGATGTLTFAPGETSKPVPLQVIGDTTVEPDERFRLVLSEPTGAALGKTQGVATIANDDAAIKRLAPKRIDVKVTPSRDRSRPFRYRVSGKVVLPTGVTRANGCAGRVSVQIKRGRKTISTRRRTVTGACTFVSRVTFGDKTRLPRSGRLKVTVRFLGNGVLLPRGAKSKFVRFGR